MIRLPHADRAILNIRKLEQYCLDPAHPRGRHKARVFREALGISQRNAGWLRDALLNGIKRAEALEIGADGFGTRWRVDLPLARQDRECVVRTVWIVGGKRRVSAVRHVLGVVAMAKRTSEKPDVLSVVALLADRPSDGLARGQVGTVVEALDENTALVEFSDDQGRAYAIVPCALSQLMTLHYVPQAA